MALLGLLAAWPAAAAEDWEPGPPMSVARLFFGLVELPSGALLAPGGHTADPGWTKRVDFYTAPDPAFTEIAPMPTSHRNFKQTILLGDGRVLVAGEHYDTAISQSHLFDESSLSWSSTVNHPAINRFAAAMVLLPNGRVLYAGGYNGGAGGPTYDSAEIFDPATALWASTNSMVAQRAGHTLTLFETGPLAGKVLVTGGGRRIDLPVESRCELFDPATNTFALTGPLNVGRTLHTATLLPDGRVLVTGGRQAGLDTNNLSSVEIFDPASAAWSLAAPMSVRRAAHTATLLQSGEVLVAGGARVGNQTDVNASAEIFNPATGAWRWTLPMDDARTGHSAILLPDGNVLVAGGDNGVDYLATTEIFETASAPPIAVAGPDQLVRPNVLVELDGAASSDDVTPFANLDFAWTLTAKPAGSLAVLNGADTATPTFAADLRGVYTAELVVTDEDGHAVGDSVSVVANGAPTASPSSNSPLMVGETFNLSGLLSSDPEGEALSCQWLLVSAPAGSTATLVNPNHALASLTADLPGTYRVALLASDAIGPSPPAYLDLLATPLFGDGFESGDASAWSEAIP